MQKPDGLYVKPHVVGLYAEAQVGHHCGAHAMNSMLHRSAIQDPTFITSHLINTQVPRQGWDNSTVGYYDANGNYQAGTLSHWYNVRNVQRIEHPCCIL